MVLLCIVTAPFCAQKPPFVVAPVLIVIEVNAAIVPLNTAVVPIVAELPTCQNTLFALAPLARITDRPLATVKVADVWKTQTAPEFPPASNVKSPDVIEKTPD